MYSLRNALIKTYKRSQAILCFLKELKLVHQKSHNFVTKNAIFCSNNVAIVCNVILIFFLLEIYI